MADSAWKRDSIGDYIEMTVGEKKDYSKDFVNAVPGAETIDQRTLTVGAAVSVVGASQLNGKIVKFYLLAVAEGVAECVLTVETATLVLKEKFRVVVKV